MQIQINSDGIPIYQQIVQQIRHRIVSGILGVGDELPTIRGLAETLRVNPNTVARAYRELENEGLVEKRRTTGTFVSQWTQTLPIAQRRKMLQPEIERVAVLAAQLQIPIEQVTEMLKKSSGRLS
ncbi:MAG: GntR family transcriptional regulator [Planctomycetota bacterium]